MSTSPFPHAGSPTADHVDRETTERIDGLLDELAVVAAEWRSVRRALEHAVTHQAHALRTAERRMDSALSGLGLRRWRHLVAGRAQIYSSRDGLDMIRARRIRPEVEAAIAHLDTVRNLEADQVAVADRQVAEVAGQLVPYGPLATEATGCSMAELRRLAAAVRNH
jgi:hypothetical protein